jgi:hypothetical protein
MGSLSGVSNGAGIVWFDGFIVTREILSFESVDSVDSCHASRNVRWKTVPTMPSPRVCENENAMKHRLVVDPRADDSGRMTIRQGGIPAGQGRSRIGARALWMALVSSSLFGSLWTSFWVIDTCSSRLIVLIPS